MWIIRISSQNVKRRATGSPLLYPCTLVPLAVPGRTLVPSSTRASHRLAPTSVPEENEHVQIQALLTVVDGGMGATAVYRYVVAVGAIAVDGDACSRDTNNIWMTARNGSKLVKTASEAGVIGFYSVIVAMSMTRVRDGVNVSPIHGGRTRERR